MPPASSSKLIRASKRSPYTNSDMFVLFARDLRLLLAKHVPEVLEVLANIFNGYVFWSIYTALGVLIWCKSLNSCVRLFHH